MNKQQYPQLDMQVYRQTLPNGLPVVVVPRPGFAKKLAYFITDFGSVHCQFTRDGQRYTFPAGIAHFLEHKLFDMPGRDITAEFAAMGAAPNAFTGYDMTAYYFSCTQRFDDCLRLLLEFVSTGCFTAESIAKEQGIIGQEIDMNLDSPDTRIFEQLMEAMYREHPIREPILGTRQSIGTLTPEQLSLCHDTFYRPENMLLCVVGDVDPERVKEIAMETLPDYTPAQIRLPRQWPEDMTCRKDRVSARMEVAMPIFQLGFKCEPLGKGAEAVRREIVGDLAAEALFGESSRLYLQMYEQGLIDSSFGGGFETVEGMAMLTASGDSNDPEGVRDAILARAEELCREGLEEEAFLRMKRSAMGRRLRGLDSFDSTCFRICAYHFSDFDYFRFPEIYREITPKEITDFLQRVVTPQRMCLSVIYPIEEETT